MEKKGKYVSPEIEIIVLSDEMTEDVMLVSSPYDAENYDLEDGGKWW